MTLWDLIECSTPGFPVLHYLLRTWKCQSLSRVLPTPLFIGFSRQEYWNGLPFPSPVCRELWTKQAAATSLVCFTIARNYLLVLTEVAFYSLFHHSHIRLHPCNMSVLGVGHSSWKVEDRRHYNMEGGREWIPTGKDPQVAGLVQCQGYLQISFSPDFHKIIVFPPVKTIGKTVLTFSKQE